MGIKANRPVQRVEYILEKCSGKRVLHLGCTNWPYTENSLKDGTLLHTAIEERSSKLFGIDADERGLEILRNEGFEDLFIGNLEDLDRCELDETFDVVVAGEIIEHLNNPGLFLSGVKRFLASDSILLITTINAYCAMRYFVYAARGKGGTNEPVHPDHVAYYSFSTLRLLLARHGFKDPKIVYYDLGDEHRRYSHKLVNAVNDISTYFFPHFSDGLIAECRL